MRTLLQWSMMAAIVTVQAALQVAATVDQGHEIACMAARNELVAKVADQAGLEVEILADKQAHPEDDDCDIYCAERQRLHDENSADILSLRARVKALCHAH